MMVVTVRIVGTTTDEARDTTSTLEHLGTKPIGIVRCIENEKLILAMKNSFLIIQQSWRFRNNETEFVRFWKSTELPILRTEFALNRVRVQHFKLSGRAC